jgi:hypothetical protein
VGNSKKKRLLRLFDRSGPPRVYQPRSFAVIYTALLVAGVAGAVGVYFLLLTFVPGAKAARLDVAKTALLVVGGSGAVAGLYVAYRKQRTDEATHVRDQDKLFTERYTQAVAQLGSDKAAVRLGGVYALARIADDSERDRPTCLKVLCAYLRMPYDPDSDTADKAEHEVRTTAQVVLAERLRPSHPGFWRWAEVDLSHACLNNLDFSCVEIDEFRAAKVTFQGVASFDESNFHTLLDLEQATFDEYATFRESTFHGVAWFSEAVFHRGCSFRQAVFDGDALFNGTSFELGGSFDESTFRGGEVRFNGAILGSKAPPSTELGLSTTVFCSGRTGSRSLTTSSGCQRRQLLSRPPAVSASARPGGPLVSLPEVPMSSWWVRLVHQG